jgi:hypothetical protein
MNPVLWSITTAATLLRHLCVSAGLDRIGAGQAHSTVGFYIGPNITTACFGQRSQFCDCGLPLRNAGSILTHGQILNTGL